MKVIEEDPGEPEPVTAVEEDSQELQMAGM